MSDVKIKVIDSDKLINAINEGSYDEFICRYGTRGCYVGY